MRWGLQDYEPDFCNSHTKWGTHLVWMIVYANFVDSEFICLYHFIPKRRQCQTWLAAMVFLLTNQRTRTHQCAPVRESRSEDTICVQICARRHNALLMGSAMTVEGRYCVIAIGKESNGIDHLFNRQESKWHQQITDIKDVRFVTKSKSVQFSKTDAGKYTYL